MNGFEQWCREKLGVEGFNYIKEINSKFIISDMLPPAGMPFIKQSIGPGSQNQKLYKELDTLKKKLNPFIAAHVKEPIVCYQVEYNQKLTQPDYPFVTDSHLIPLAFKISNDNHTFEQFAKTNGLEYVKLYDMKAQSWFISPTANKEKGSTLDFLYEKYQTEITNKQTKDSLTRDELVSWEKEINSLINDSQLKKSIELWRGVDKNVGNFATATEADYTNFLLSLRMFAAVYKERLTQTHYDNLMKIIQEPLAGESIEDRLLGLRYADDQETKLYDSFMHENTTEQQVELLHNLQRNLQKRRKLAVRNKLASPDNILIEAKKLEEAFFNIEPDEAHAILSNRPNDTEVIICKDMVGSPENLRHVCWKNGKNVLSGNMIVTNTGFKVNEIEYPFLNRALEELTEKPITALKPKDVFHVQPNTAETNIEALKQSSYLIPAGEFTKFQANDSKLPDSIHNGIYLRQGGWPHSFIFSNKQNTSVRLINATASGYEDALGQIGPFKTVDDLIIGINQLFTPAQVIEYETFKKAIADAQTPVIKPVVPEAAPQPYIPPYANKLQAAAPLPGAPHLKTLEEFIHNMSKEKATDYLHNLNLDRHVIIYKTKDLGTLDVAIKKDNKIQYDSIVVDEKGFRLNNTYYNKVSDLVAAIAQDKPVILLTAKTVYHEQQMHFLDRTIRGVNKPEDQDRINKINELKFQQRMFYQDEFLNVEPGRELDTIRLGYEPIPGQKYTSEQLTKAPDAYSINEQNRRLTRYSAKYGPVSFYLNNQTDEAIIIPVITGCAPNLMGTSQIDIEEFTIAGRLNVDKYKNVESLPHLYFSNMREDKLITSTFGLGAYIKQLNPIDHDKARTIMFQAFINTAKQYNKKLDWVVWQDPNDPNGRAVAEEKAKIYRDLAQGQEDFVNVVLHHDILLYAKECQEDKKEKVAILNPGSDRTVGGKYIAINPPTLEEQIAEKSDLVLLHSNLNQPMVEDFYKRFGYDKTTNHFTWWAHDVLAEIGVHNAFSITSPLPNQPDPFYSIAFYHESIFAELQRHLQSKGVDAICEVRDSDPALPNEFWIFIRESEWPKLTRLKSKTEIQKANKAEFQEAGKLIKNRLEIKVNSLWIRKENDHYRISFSDNNRKTAEGYAQTFLSTLNQYGIKGDQKEKDTLNFVQNNKHEFVVYLSENQWNQLPQIAQNYEESKKVQQQKEEELLSKQQEMDPEKARQLKARYERLFQESENRKGEFIAVSKNIHSRLKMGLTETPPRIKLVDQGQYRITFKMNGENFSQFLTKNGIKGAKGNIEVSEVTINGAKYQALYINQSQWNHLYTVFKQLEARDYHEHMKDLIKEQFKWPDTSLRISDNDIGTQKIILFSDKEKDKANKFLEFLKSNGIKFIEDSQKRTITVSQTEWKKIDSLISESANKSVDVKKENVDPNKDGPKVEPKKPATVEKNRAALIQKHFKGAVQPFIFKNGLVSYPNANARDAQIFKDALEKNGIKGKTVQINTDTTVTPNKTYHLISVTAEEWKIIDTIFDGMEKSQLNQSNMAATGGKPTEVPGVSVGGKKPEPAKPGVSVGGKEPEPAKPGVSVGGKEPEPAKPGVSVGGKEPEPAKPGVSVGGTTPEPAKPNALKPGVKPVPNDSTDSKQKGSEQNYLDLITKKLLPLTKDYAEYLETTSKGLSEEDQKVLDSKLKPLKKLVSILEGTEKLPNAYDRVEKFYTKLDKYETAITIHRDPDWKRYLKNTLIAGGILITGILPGLIALLVYTNTGNTAGKSMEFWKSRGQTFFGKSQDYKLKDEVSKLEETPKEKPSQK